MRSQGTLVCLYGFAMCWGGRMSRGQREEDWCLGWGGGGIHVSSCFHPVKSNKDQVSSACPARRDAKVTEQLTASPCPCPGGPDRNMWDSLDLLALGWLRKWKSPSSTWTSGLPEKSQDAGESETQPVGAGCAHRGRAVILSLCCPPPLFLLSPLQGLCVVRGSSKWNPLRLGKPGHPLCLIHPRWALHFVYLLEWSSGFALSHPHWLSWSFMWHTCPKWLPRLQRSVCSQGRERRLFSLFCLAGSPPQCPTPSRSSSEPRPHKACPRSSSSCCWSLSQATSGPCSKEHNLAPDQPQSWQLVLTSDCFQCLSHLLPPSSLVSPTAPSKAWAHSRC